MDEDHYAERPQLDDLNIQESIDIAYKRRCETHVATWGNGEIWHYGGKITEIKMQSRVLILDTCRVEVESMKNMRFYIVSGFAVLISIFVILFAWIKFVDLTFSEKISKEVMLASIGLIGAIVGGTISGLLTLFGVKMTIKENHDKDFNESLPEKIMFAEDIITVIENQLKLIDGIDKKYVEASRKNPVYRTRIGFIIKYLEEDGLLVKSSKINLTTYRSTRTLYDYLKMVSYDERPVALPYIEIREYLANCLIEIRNENDKFLKRINI